MLQKIPPLDPEKLQNSISVNNNNSNNVNNSTNALFIEQQNLQIQLDSLFRDLKKSMGALGDQSRKELYIERFSMGHQTQDLPPFHYGSHYSSPAIVSQYLLRVNPFTEISRVIQGG